MNFKERLCVIDNGRFKPLLDTLPGLKDVCEGCDHFNPTIQDPNKGYRCKVSGYCPAATLHPNLQAYLWKKIPT